jgi:DNA-binding transcriptional MerR regulator
MTGVLGPRTRSRSSWYRRAVDADQAGERLSIGQVAARTGMSVHALRFYERAGLFREEIQRVGGRRVYAQEDVDWLELCVLLRQAGMPLAAIRQYAQVVRRGDGTETERLQLLRRHQRHIASQLRDLSRCLDIINHKIGVYEDLIERGLPASSCHGPQPQAARPGASSSRRPRDDKAASDGQDGAGAETGA